MAIKLVVKRRGSSDTCPCLIELLVCVHLLYWAATAMVWFFDTGFDNSNSLRNVDDIWIIEDHLLLAPPIDASLLFDVLCMWRITCFLINVGFVWSNHSRHSHRDHLCFSHWNVGSEICVVVGAGPQCVS